MTNSETAFNDEELIARLRSQEELTINRDGASSYQPVEACLAAADRIDELITIRDTLRRLLAKQTARAEQLAATNERLEAALREILEKPRNADLTYAELFAEVVSEARAALEPVAAPVALEAKMAALPQERQDRINAEADRLAALDDLARLGQEFDAETEAGGSIIQGLREALEYTKGMLVDAVKHDPAPDPAAIREAAAVVDREIEQAKQLMPMVVPILRGVHRNILALIAKGAAE